MHDENTKIKDLTEIERLIIGSSLNFVYNLLSSQINHIENHDENLLNLLNNNEELQEDLILLKNFRSTTEELTELFGEILLKLSDEDKEILSKPGIKLDFFFREIFLSVSCGDHIDEDEEE